MFSVRLLPVVACVLLILDTIQAESDVGQSPPPQHSKSSELIKAAKEENEKAITLVDSLISKDVMVTDVKFGLTLVQQQLNELSQGTATHRLGHLLTALSYEFFAYFLPGQCTGHKECDQTSRHVQRATGKIVAASLSELADEVRNSKEVEKKEKMKTIRKEIKKVIRGNITENGNIVRGVSVQETKEVAKKVQDLLEQL